MIADTAISWHKRRGKETLVGRYRCQQEWC